MQYSKNINKKKQNYRRRNLVGRSQLFNAKFHSQSVPKCLLLTDVHVHVRYLRYMLSPVRLWSVCLSVCLSSVSNARAPYSINQSINQSIYLSINHSSSSNFRQYFYGIRYLGHPLTSTENFTEMVPGEPLRRGS